MSINGIISYTSYDHESYTMVPVIASFDSEGHVKPLYVRIEGEPRKIDSYWVRNNFANQTEFVCKAVFDDRLQPLTLTYFREECMWRLNSAPTADAGKNP